MSVRTNHASIRRTIAITAALAAVALTSTSCASSSGGGAEGEDKTVAFLVPSTVQSKWTANYDLFTEKLKEEFPNVETVMYNANASDSTQQSQVDTALTRGADAIVLVSVDSTSAARMVQVAAQSDVPVVSYDHPIMNTADLSLFVGVDGIAQGQATGEWVAENAPEGSRVLFLNGSPTDDNAVDFNEGYHSVLDPLIESGKLEMVGEDWVPGWDPQTAQSTFEQLLTKAGGDVDVVVVPWDDGAGVVSTVLRNEKLSDVLVTGGDANLAGLQRVLLGQQSMTVIRDDQTQSVVSAQAIAGLLKDGKVPSDLITGSADYGAGDVPTHLLIPKVYTIDTINELVDSGWVTKEDLCNGIPAGSGPC